MKILAIETSTAVGSVALVEDNEVRLALHHDEPNRHAEKMLSLVGEALRAGKWARTEVARIAVGVGPGTFTGIRVGLALAQGLALGLGVPAVGVGSLRILAVGHPQEDRRLRVVLRDARREEFFLAAYGPAGEEVLAPEPIPQSGAAERVQQLFAGHSVVFLGDRVPGLPWEQPTDSQVPWAGALGRLAAELDPATHPVAPQYVRGTGATKPALQLSPLRLPRR
jgi:tRNA threonylcarbamoyladenosine biosynthesis protein TsaB